MHEAQTHEHNAFITLTYSDEGLTKTEDDPLGKSLHYSDFQGFMKRLREFYGSGIRFFVVGEYGLKFGRPHWHALLFNHRFPDQKLWRKNRGFPLFTSERLTKLWPHGFHSIGEANFQTAAYCARYSMKKITGEPAESHYEYIDFKDGQIYKRRPEFAKMSLQNGGIGKGWFDEFHSDVYPSDFCLIRKNGELHKAAPPKFYDRHFELAYPSDFAKLRARRKRKALAHSQKDDRIRTREEYCEIRKSLLIRGYDHGS